MKSTANTTANNEVNEVLEGQLTLEDFITEVAINQAYINLLIAIKNA